MKEEVKAALQFLVPFIKRMGSIKDELLEQFHQLLEKTLIERYEGHWYTDKPMKGQAYRSLEFTKENQFCDTTVDQVCHKLGLSSKSLGIRQELILWIDPYEVSLRLGSHVSLKDQQQFVIARFSTNGETLFQHDLDIILSQCRSSTNSTSRLSPPLEKSDENIPSVPMPRTSSPKSVLQPSRFHNGPLFTPLRALSPQAAPFEMSSPINVPSETSIDSIDECSSVDDIRSQPDRSDTPHSMHSTTSNESSDSGYCGYVESYPYYYKLNRLNRALAMQRITGNKNVGKNPHPRRPPRQHHVVYRPASPPTPTPHNIDQLAAFYQRSLYMPQAQLVGDFGQSNY